MLGWRKGERSGWWCAAPVSLRVRLEPDHSGWWPRALGANVEHTLRTRYDGRGRVSTTYMVERGYSAMLTQPELGAA